VDGFDIFPSANAEGGSRLSEAIQGNGRRQVLSNRSRGAKTDEGRTSVTFRAPTRLSAFFSDRVRKLAVGHGSRCLVLRAGWPGAMLATRDVSIRLR
jgi:hypothetical protein